MKNKRGDMHYILIAFILGLVVLSFALYFIFQEYFTSETLDMESCRQSVVLRGTLPEADFAGLTPISFKDDFPLKCKTQVYQITKEDVEKELAGKIIADAMVQCWAIFGNGDYSIFPSKLLGSDSFCVPCARVHLNEDAKKYLLDHPEKTIDIQKTLETSVFKGVLYKAYLDGVGERPAIGKKDIGAEVFKIGDDPSLFENVVDGFWSVASYVPVGWLLEVFRGVEMQEIYEPKVLDPNAGDLLIVYNAITLSGGNEDDSGSAYLPQLFYFQIDQNNPDPFEEIEEKELIKGTKKLSLGICEN